MNILEKIVDTKRCEVSALRETGYYNAVSSMEYPEGVPSMVEALKKSSTGIIAEFKRRSPSKGLINSSANVVDTVCGYAANGAAASSVLTDTAYFGGSVVDLACAAKAVDKSDFPLLRKEFVIAHEQIDEARAFGASAVLLIASVLSHSELRDMASYAHHVGLEILVEIHSLDELDKVIHISPDMLGVNSRNLADMSTDVAHTESLGLEVARRMPDALLVAESGIESMEDVIRLRRYGYSGFLIGERFMREYDPAHALYDFLGK